MVALDVGIERNAFFQRPILRFRSGHWNRGRGLLFKALTRELHDAEDDHGCAEQENEIAKKDEERTFSQGIFSSMDLSKTYHSQEL